VPAGRKKYMQLNTVPKTRIRKRPGAIIASYNRAITLSPIAD
jgi:hypothetical protein